MAKKLSISEYCNGLLRKVEKTEEVLAWRTQVLRDHATDLDWPSRLANSLKVVDDGTGHRVWIDPENKEEIRNLEYPMPGQPAKPAITTFHYGLGEF
jgi:hypothetical protein